MSLEETSAFNFMMKECEKDRNRRDIVFELLMFLVCKIIVKKM